MDSLTYIQLLRLNPSFRRLWMGQVISELGNWFNFLAGLGLVREVSHGAPEVTTTLLLARLIPFTLFAPFAGAFADRWSRRTVMIVTDLGRVVFALGFLLVHKPEDLWIAYGCTAALSFLGCFFEAAKNSVVPNITGERDLLPGNALMLSSRFLLMSFGAALGGWTSALLGYQAAFVINAISFVISAYSIWLIPGKLTRSVVFSHETATRSTQKRNSYWSDIREGWIFIISNGPVATILSVNFLWATGGGAINLMCDRLGGIVFVGEHGLSGDSAVAALYASSGLGLFIGMMMARRVGGYFETIGKTTGFIGFSLVLQGVVFAMVGLMPNLWLACLFFALSRVIIGAEYTVQETLLMRLVPDNLRGRVSTTDRAAELLVWSVATAVAGWSLQAITPRALTVIGGLLSSSGGILWILLFATQKVRLPGRSEVGESATENLSLAR